MVPDPCCPDTMLFQSPSPKFRYCQKCQVFKLPRMHHCSTCNKCCLKYNHHCKLIANCIGINNYHLYIIYLIMTMCVSLSSLDFPTVPPLLPLHQPRQYFPELPDLGVQPPQSHSLRCFSASQYLLCKLRSAID